MPGSLTFASSFGIKLITRVARTAARITEVYTRMITSSIVCFTWTTLYPLAFTLDVRAAAMSPMSWGRIVTAAVSGLNPIITWGFEPACWEP